MEPLAIDLYAGLGGWAEGFLSEGYDVTGFDLERHVYGEHCYPGQLVLQDVLTIDGARFRDAAVIVASPPCQEPSYRAMPWSRAKALNAAGPPVKFIELFEACFRIQREASAAAGRHIPLIVENVKGAQPWVGRAKWHYGSFYLWGDVPALMPSTQQVKRADRNFHAFEKGASSSPAFNGGEHETRNLKTGSVKIGGAVGDDWFTHHNRPEFLERAGVKGTPGHTLNKVPGVQSVGFNVMAVRRMKEGMKTDGIVYQRDGATHTRHLTNQAESDAVKNGGNGTWFGVSHGQEYPGQPGNARDNGVKGFTPHGEPLGKNQLARRHGSKSNARKQASAMIAKIPFPLAQYLARVFKPEERGF